jgi:hypothetical protein
MKYDKRHGGPYDRGSADYYYRRPYNPHYYIGATYSTSKIEASEMTSEEIEAYRAGYDEAEDLGDRKEW